MYAKSTLFLILFSFCVFNTIVTSENKFLNILMPSIATWRIVQLTIHHLNSIKIKQENEINQLNHFINNVTSLNKNTSLFNKTKQYLSKTKKNTDQLLTIFKQDFIDDYQKITLKDLTDINNNILSSNNISNCLNIINPYPEDIIECPICYLSNKQLYKTCYSCYQCWLCQDCYNKIKKTDKIENCPFCREAIKFPSVLDTNKIEKFFISPFTINIVYLFYHGNLQTICNDFLKEQSNFSTLIVYCTLCTYCILDMLILGLISALLIRNHATVFDQLPSVHAS